MLLYLLILVGVFGFCVVKMVQEKRQKEKPLLFAAMVYTAVLSLITTVVYLFLPCPDTLLFCLIAVTMGGLLTLVSVQNLMAVKQCSVVVMGKYCGYNTYSGKNGASSHAAMFAYTYQGRKYKQQTMQTSSRRLLEQMTPGESYPIYVDDLHPTIFVLEKRVRFGDMALLLFGVVILLLGVVVLFTV